MSESDVYPDEMPNSRFSDQDVERLLSGDVPEGDELAAFVPLVEELRAEWMRQPSAESVASFSAAAAEIAATQDGALVTGEPAKPTRRSNLRLRRKLAIPLAAALALSGMTGAAIASNDALPGDSLLYEVKIALETVGLRTGGVAERLNEAAALAERGRAADALAHAANAVAQVGTAQAGTEEALTGLENAISQLQQSLPEQGDTDHATEVRANVAAMLQWMRDNVGLIDDPEAEPGAFGRGVADRARQISGQGDPEGAGGEGGPPSGVNPGGPPEGVPPTQP
jgi:hypothetical protein